jgi:hypothetical protein
MEYFLPLQGITLQPRDGEDFGHTTTLQDPIAVETSDDVMGTTVAGTIGTCLCASMAIFLKRVRIPYWFRPARHGCNVRHGKYATRFAQTIRFGTRHNVPRILGL